MLATRNPDKRGELTALLGDLGINSGVVGSKVGTTTRLQLDTAKLSAALSSNPGGVAQLLGSGGGIMGPLINRLKTLTGNNGMVDSRLKGLDSSLRSNATSQDQVQSRIDLRETALEAKFAALEATLAQLQSTQAQVASQANSLSK